MDILVELIRAAVTVGVIVAIALGMGALFIIMLSIATGIDSNIQPEDDRTRT